MKTRLIAAIVGLSILLPSIIWGGPLAVEIIVGLAVLVCLDEYARMAFPEENLLQLGWLVLTGGAVYGAGVYGPVGAAGPTFAIAAMATFAFMMLRPPERDLDRAAQGVGRHLLGLAWIPGFFAFVPHLRNMEFGLTWLFVMLVIPWSGDTGGYFAGRFFGRSKLYELVSPKKTWAGVYGGWAGSVLGLLVVRSMVPEALTVVDCLVLGVGLGSAGVCGDLCESMVKRAFKVKDSGWIMPGHGGLLDRVDSVLFVAPLLFAYLTLVKGV